MMDKLGEVPQTQNELMVRMSALSASRDMAARRSRDSFVNFLKAVGEGTISLAFSASAVSMIPKLYEMGLHQESATSPEGLLRLAVVAIGTGATVVGLNKTYNAGERSYDDYRDAQSYTQYADALEPTVIAGINAALPKMPVAE